MWSMNLSSSKLTWERVKKSGIAPTTRSSLGSAFLGKRMIVFGGVKDEEDERNPDEMKSIFYNDM